jgi:hypothetical protein
VAFAGSAGRGTVDELGNLIFSKIAPMLGLSME